jgi:kanamycin nucleotidyltransferase
MEQQIRKDNARIAESITNRLVSTHKNELTAIGVFGSIANNTYDQYSDIDLVIITKSNIKDKFFILLNSNNGQEGDLILGSDVKVSLFFLTKEEAASQLLSISDFSWPIKAAMLLDVVPLYDPKNMFPALHDEYIKLKKNLLTSKKFDQLAGKWLSVAYEFLGKINKPNSSRQESFVYAERFSFAIAGTYKALYQDYFKNIYKITDEIQELSHYHQHAIDLIETLLTLRDEKMIHQLSMELWLTANRYAKSRNIKIESCEEDQLNTLLKTL